MATHTNNLPFAMIDAFGFFTIFNSESDAAAIADGINVQNASDGVTDCEAVVSIRMVA